MKRWRIIVCVPFSLHFCRIVSMAAKVPSVYNWHINLHCLDDEIYLLKSETLLFRIHFWPLFVDGQLDWFFGIWGFWEFQASRRDSYKQNCGKVALPFTMAQVKSYWIFVCLHFLIEFETEDLIFFSFTDWVILFPGKVFKVGVLEICESKTIY